MLDKRTEKVLYLINQKCEDGEYKILEAQDILSALGKSASVKEDSLSDIIQYLCEREYVRCKYSDSGVYCMAPLPKGRLYHENKISVRKQKLSYRRLVVFAFLGSLLGGALGAAVHAFVVNFIGR